METTRKQKKRRKRENPIDLQRVLVYINKSCRSCRRSKRKEDHVILPIPGRDDAYFAFCEKWNNRLFLVWERDGEFHHKLIGGTDGYQVVPMKESIVLDGNIVGIYCSVDNTIGSSGGAQLYYDLGEPGQAQPVTTGKSSRACIGY